MDREQAIQPEREHDIARLLAYRYGDGGIYVPRQLAHTNSLEAAINGGFISSDGFITRKGRRLLAQFDL